MDTLLEDPSPHGNAMAVVEHDGRSVFFYLFGDKESGWGMKTCWVRNLAPLWSADVTYAFAPRKSVV